MAGCQRGQHGTAGALTLLHAMRGLLGRWAVGLLFDSIPAQDNFAVPPVLQEAGLNDTILSVGGVGAGLPFHNHATAW